MNDPNSLSNKIQALNVGELSNKQPIQQLQAFLNALGVEQYLVQFSQAHILTIDSILQLNGNVLDALDVKDPMDRYTILMAIGYIKQSRGINVTDWPKKPNVASTSAKITTPTPVKVSSKPTLEPTVVSQAPQQPTQPVHPIQPKKAPEPVQQAKPPRPETKYEPQAKTSEKPVDKEAEASRWSLSGLAASIPSFGAQKSSGEENKGLFQFFTKTDTDEKKAAPAPQPQASGPPPIPKRQYQAYPSAAQHNKSATAAAQQAPTQTGPPPPRPQNPPSLNAIYHDTINNNKAVVPLANPSAPPPEPQRTYQPYAPQQTQQLHQPQQPQQPLYPPIQQPTYPQYSQGVQHQPPAYQPQHNPYAHAPVQYQQQPPPRPQAQPQHLSTMPLGQSPVYPQPAQIQPHAAINPAAKSQESSMFKIPSTQKKKRNSEVPPPATAIPRLGRQIHITLLEAKFGGKLNHLIADYVLVVEDNGQKKKNVLVEGLQL
eukprot:CAMPEP_0168523906 /NCGR_PEP_ID=MMETSP0405-20121227/10294_1 /TAXON_ID=498012 /ORGANISM="Trichosphaerium sp, Strain Am-I-7 wt" /LENGTH=485 /DNA_ID=CAMNT_0008545933 /DNA_START=1 /DNA_END=1459 /DNA_ORIENTATION=-